MADPTLDPGTGDDSGGLEPDRGSTTGMPRWVKALLIVTLVVVLLLMILLLTGGGHGPGRHMIGGGVPADEAQAARMVEVTTLDTMTFEPRTISVSGWFGHSATFECACHTPDHYLAGMRGEITIT